MEEVILMGYITREKHISERVIDPDGICFTLMAMTHGYGPGCYKFGAATLLREKGAIMTKVIEIYEEDTPTERLERNWFRRECLGY